MYIKEINRFEIVIPQIGINSIHFTIFFLILFRKVFFLEQSHINCVIYVGWKDRVLVKNKVITLLSLVRGRNLKLISQALGY